MNEIETHEFPAMPTHCESTRKVASTTEKTSSQVSGKKWASNQAVDDNLRSTRNTAEKTNFRTLDATFEATRALAVGRGFVVATNEVQLLVDPMADATEVFISQGEDTQKTPGDADTSKVDLSKTNNEIVEKTKSTVSTAAEHNSEFAEHLRHEQAATTVSGSSPSQVPASASDPSEQSSLLRRKVQRITSNLRAA